MKSITYALIALLFFSISCKTDQKNAEETVAKGPIAKKIPEALTIHNDTRIDNYFWMRLSDAQKNADTADAQTQDVYRQ